MAASGRVRSSRGHKTGEKVGREMGDDGEKDKEHDRGRWKKPNYSVKSQH